MDIWTYLKTYFSIKEENPENLVTFVNTTGNDLVPLHTVALALDDLAEDMGNIINEVVKVHEERLRDIVSELPEEVQFKIKQKFMDSGDDLFTEGEQNNGKQENI